MPYNNLDTLEGLILEIENELEKAERVNVLSSGWTSTFPDLTGIYCFRKDDAIVYIGETANLRDRLHKDTKNTQNHTIRRNIGKLHFCDHPEYTVASSSKKYAICIEEAINDLMKTLTVSFVPVYVGRLEVEEFLILKYEPIYNSKINKRSLK